MAKRDYGLAYNGDDAHPTFDRTAINAANPNMLWFCNAQQRDLMYNPPWNGYVVDSEVIGAVPTAWIMRQVGTTLSSGVGSTATTIPVTVTTLSATVNGTKSAGATTVSFDGLREFLLVGYQLVIDGNTYAIKSSDQNGWIHQADGSYSAPDMTKAGVTITPAL